MRRENADHDGRGHHHQWTALPTVEMPDSTDCGYGCRRPDCRPESLLPVAVSYEPGTGRPFGFWCCRVPFIYDELQCIDQLTQCLTQQGGVYTCLGQKRSYPGSIGSGRSLFSQMLCNFLQVPGQGLPPRGASGIQPDQMITGQFAGFP